MPGTKGQILFHLHKIFRVVGFVRTERRMVLTRGQRGREWGDSVQHGEMVQETNGDDR